jgi:hypothetical protein
MHSLLDIELATQLDRDRRSTLRPTVRSVVSRAHG